ncbi:MAG: ATP phosphoribosyltransferase regulatory subunit [Lachnospiraceae bacterium]|nr:ATP phosphoribosyltransferase regulatory subunit [Lachnospiraceae bacterium]
MEKLLHTPEGVRDLHDAECEKKQQLEGKLRHCLHRFGFRDVVTPTFEYFDIFRKERGTVPSKDMYKFIDREGNTLVLRPDMTPSIARCVAKYYKEETNPLRLSYRGNTFVDNSGYRGKLKETTQIGAELINDASVVADAEMVALMAECLKAGGLKEFQIEIGHVGFFTALAKEAGFSEEEAAEVREFIESKNLFSVEQVLSGKQLKPELKELLLKLPEFFGSVEKLQEVRSMTNNEEACAALDHLMQLHRYLESFGVASYISYDLGMLGKYGYYTGINFRALTYKTGESVAAGGRYDHLMGQFGKQAPAIGIALYVDTLLLGLSRQGLIQEQKDERTLVVYEKQAECDAIRFVCELRAEDVDAMLEEKCSDTEWSAYEKRIGTNGITQIYMVTTEDIQSVK